MGSRGHRRAPRRLCRRGSPGTCSPAQAGGAQRSPGRLRLQSSRSLGAGRPCLLSPPSTPCAPSIPVEPTSAGSAPHPVRTEDWIHLMFPGSRAKNTLVRVAYHFVHVPRARLNGSFAVPLAGASKTP